MPHALAEQVRRYHSALINTACGKMTGPQLPQTASAPHSLSTPCWSPKLVLMY